MQLPTGTIPRLCHACSLQLLILSLAFIDTLLATATFEMRFRDQVEKLISDEQYYTGLKRFEADSIGVITFLPHRNTLLIGAKNTFYEVNLNHTFPEEIQERNWTATESKITDCLLKGAESEDCQNFIQVMEYDQISKQLVVCGTHAQDPMCKGYESFMYEDLTSLPVVAAVDGKKKCPFDPTQKSTALFADGALYTATVGDYSGRDSVIYRSSVGPSDVVHLRSREADSKWFNTPTFIASFEVEEWVLLFFREVAVEHVNSGDAIYARVAKVCKTDMGGTFVLKDTWTTYQKARLNCSFPGAYPFYFNYLQDVWMVGEGNDRMFYGVFSTGGHEIPGSAVCMFNMEDIRNIFNEGQFKEQMSGNWYAVPRGREPSPRPGNCSLDSKLQSDLSLQFITHHPLMDEAVPSYLDPNPIFDLTRADFRLTQIAAYQQKAKDNVSYTVLFLGTEHGAILKVVLVPDPERGRVLSNLLETIYVRPRDCQERIEEMEIIKTTDGNKSEDMLMVVTNTSVVEVPLQRCANYTSSCSCTQDPFCVWNTIMQQCLEFKNNEFDEQMVDVIQDCEEDFSVPSTTPADCICTPPLVPSTGSDKGTDTEVQTLVPGGSGNEVNDASTMPNSSIEQVLLVLLIAGWALFLICVPVILFLIRSNRRKAIHQKSAGNPTTCTENHLHLNGNSTFHHLFPPPSPAESSTDPATLKRPSLARTPSRAPILAGEQPTPQTDSPPARSPSRKKPPVPPKRTNSFLTHDGPRCPPGYNTGSLRRHHSQNGAPNGYVQNIRRQNSQTLPHKKRQNSSSSSESMEPQTPPYRPLSGAGNDERRRRPSGASNTEVPPEYSPGWYQNRAQEQSV